MNPWNFVVESGDKIVPTLVKLKRLISTTSEHRSNIWRTSITSSPGVQKIELFGKWDEEPRNIRTEFLSKSNCQGAHISIIITWYFMKSDGSKKDSF